jgi:uncharacterized membrane protein
MPPYTNRPQVWVGPAQEHGHRGVGFVLLVILLILVAALIGYVAARLTVGRGSAPPPAVPEVSDEPLALLRLRYARGEIDRDSFLQASSDLGGLPPPAAA